MRKIKLSVAALLIAGTSFAQNTERNQCLANTKKNEQCKNITYTKNKLCYLHNPNYKGDPSVGKTVICSGITNKNKPCKRKTRHPDGKCHHHRNKNE
tara:strand:+ start:1761 stop:2051 length:291 start_codon:yes stop_codon:yes gene_type:complete